MKNQTVKKFTRTLCVLAVISAVLAGCGRTAGEAASSVPQSGSAVSAAVPGGSDNSREAEPEDTQAGETAAPESGGAAPASTAAASDGAAADASGPETSLPDTPVPDAAAPEDAGTVPASGGGSASAESAALSGIDLNVQFGDDGASFAMHLYDNETAAKIAEYVGTADWRLPIYHYDDYDNWEVMQYYDIPSRYEIPSNPQNVTSERGGTVYYSEPNRIVLFYQDANVSSEYTPVGYFDFSQEFVDAVVNNPAVEGWGNKLVHISD